MKPQKIKKSILLTSLLVVVFSASCVGGGTIDHDARLSSAEVSKNKATEDGVDQPLSMGSQKPSSHQNADKQAESITTNGSYKNNQTLNFTVNRPGAAGISLHFSEFSTEKNYDFVNIYDKNGALLASYHGVLQPFWTSVFTGDTIYIQLKSDSSITSTGFKVDEVHFDPGEGSDESWSEQAYNLESIHPYNAFHDQSWTVYKAGASQISLHFESIDTESFSDFIYLYDKDNKLVANYDGKLTNVWTKPIAGDTVKIRLKADWAVQKYGFKINKMKSSSAAGAETLTLSPYFNESAHPYANNADTLHTITVTGASKVRVHFSKIDVEEDVDFVIVQDGSGVEKARYTGTQLSVWSPIINGAQVRIKLQSNNSGSAFGYSIDSIGHQGGTAPAAPSYSRPIFEKIVAVGDSLCHSFQSGGVEETRQPNSYCNVIAKQATGNRLNNPLLSYPGYVLPAEDIFKGKCGVFCMAKALIPSRVSKSNTNITNFAVTGADSHTVNYETGECMDYRYRERKWSWWQFSYVNACKEEASKFAKLTLLENKSQVDQAILKNPSFVIGYFTSNDSLSSALFTDAAKVSAFGEFSAHVDRAFSILTSQGARGVTASTPNVTAIGYLRHYVDPSGRADLTGLKAFYNPTVKKPGEVLDADEVASITNQLLRKNEYIRQKAASINWAYADVKIIFDSIKQFGHDVKDGNGNPVGGKKLYADWPVPGKYGVFSLDGVHPNNTGHCVLGNALIQSINNFYSQNVPLCDENATLASDSLNNDPIDLMDWLSNNIVGKLLAALVDLFL